MQENPYESPIHAERPVLTGRRTGVGDFCFWLALFFALIGLVSIFVRNSPPLGWLLLGAVFYFAATFVAHKSYRTLSAVGCVLCLIASVSIASIHHQRQLEYRRQQQMQTQLERK